MIPLNIPLTTWDLLNEEQSKMVSGLKSSSRYPFSVISQIAIKGGPFLRLQEVARLFLITHLRRIWCCYSSVNRRRQRFRESRKGKTSPASIIFGLVLSRVSSFLINSCLSSYIIICHLSHLFSLHRYRSIAISKSLPAADCRNQEPRQSIFWRIFSWILSDKFLLDKVAIFATMRRRTIIMPPCLPQLFLRRLMKTQNAIISWTKVEKFDA